MAIWLISNLVCFAWPLLITLKLLSSSYGKKTISSSSKNEQEKFLLSFWLCYLGVNYLQDSIIIKTICLPIFGFSYFPMLLFSGIKIWLFYNHGCLVITHCYFGLILRKSFSLYDYDIDPFEMVELRFLDPVMSIILTNNHFFSAVSNWLKNAITDGHYLHILLRNIETFREAFKNANLDGKSFLQFSLDYICYLDSVHELQKHYAKTSEFINSKISSIGNCYFNYFKSEDKSFIRMFQILIKGDLVEHMDSTCLKGRDFTSFSKPHVESVKYAPHTGVRSSSRTYYIEPNFLPLSRNKIINEENDPFIISPVSKMSLGEKKRVKKDSYNSPNSSSIISNPFQLARRSSYY